jgi:tetrapyrrole methylase family protein/MazG family protein/ATP diphosphatase
VDGVDQDGSNLPQLAAIVARLLAPDGCPWDRAQTLETLRPYVIEEAHEVVDAIDRGDRGALRDELGDLLFQVVFQAAIARAEGAFGLSDVVAAISAKMIRRHPWVFGDESAPDEAAASARWEAMKAAERAARDERAKGGGARSDERKGALDGVPLALPALLRALRVGEKAAAVGYDFEDAQAARAKVDEELAEMDAAADDAALERELGDVLFALASYARKRGLDPEAALRGTLERFTRRFGHAEQAAESGGKRLAQLTPAELDVLWHAAKREVG